MKRDEIIFRSSFSLIGRGRVWSVQRLLVQRRRPPMQRRAGILADFASCVFISLFNSCYFSGQRAKKWYAVCFFSGGQKEGISLPVGVQAQRTGVRAEKRGESQENTRSDCETVVCPKIQWLFYVIYGSSWLIIIFPIQITIECGSTVHFPSFFFFERNDLPGKGWQSPAAWAVWRPHHGNAAPHSQQVRPPQSPGVSEIFAPSMKRKPRSQVILRW